MTVETRQSSTFPSYQRARRRRRMLWLLSVGAVGLALLSAGVLLLVARPMGGRVTPVPDSPPVLSQVPPFSATRQDGTAITEQDLKGSIWVGNFMFTRCPNICPTFTAKMAGLQLVSARRLPQLKLVSFTVDPEYDTPARLEEYGEKYRADFARWSFLNAPVEVLESTITKGMLQPLDRGGMVDLDKVVHSAYFVLVDRSLRVRGFYRFSETSAVESVLRDAEALAREADAVLD